VTYAWSKSVKLLAGIENVFDQRDPSNFIVTSTGTHSNDPEARYGYVGARFEF
jgi:outer membrane receptor for ferrienterochelin and colicin